MLVSEQIVNAYNGIFIDEIPVRQTVASSLMYQENGRRLRLKQQVTKYR